jgi:hypothetical protein
MAGFCVEYWRGAYCDTLFSRAVPGSPPLIDIGGRVVMPLVLPVHCRVMHTTIFGLTESQLSWLGLTVGLTFLMLYMLFIIGQLAWESKAGKFGTFVLFLVLALCMMGFVIKLVIETILEHHIEQVQHERQKQRGEHRDHKQ